MVFIGATLQKVVALNMVSPRLEYLFDRYFAGTCTAEEKEAFINLMKAGVADADLIQLIENAYSQKLTDPALPEDVARSILQAIFQATDKKPIADQPESKRSDTSAASEPRGGKRAPVRLYRRWTAAAVLILLSVSGGYLWVRHVRQTAPNPESKPALAVKYDIAPGHSGAILTLANGETILLDSVREGSLVKQGNGSLIKQHGQLSYSSPNAGQEILFNTMTTPRGRQFVVVLEDGSKVWLNSASTLRYPTAFKGHRREVELTGEAYFEVQANDSMPFIVRTGRLDVQVLGTGFDVMAYEDEGTIRTTLIRGSVKVKAGSQEAMIRPGEQASLQQGQAAIRISTPDMSEVLAWKEDKFRFSKTDIRVIMRQIARWYDVDVVYNGDIPDVELSGVFPRTEYVAQLLEVLEDAGNIHFTLDKGKITVQKK